MKTLTLEMSLMASSASVFQMRNSQVQAQSELPGVFFLHQEYSWGRGHIALGALPPTVDTLLQSLPRATQLFEILNICMWPFSYVVASVKSCGQFFDHFTLFSIWSRFSQAALFCSFLLRLYLCPWLPFLFPKHGCSLRGCPLPHFLLLLLITEMYAAPMSSPLVIYS